MRYTETSFTEKFCFPAVQTGSNSQSGSRSKVIKMPRSVELLHSCPERHEARVVVLLFLSSMGIQLTIIHYIFKTMTQYIEYSKAEAISKVSACMFVPSATCCIFLRF